MFKQKLKKIPSSKKARDQNQAHTYPLTLPIQ